MKPIPLCHVWDYRERDREFWNEHLEGWMPRHVVDAHIHLARSDQRLRPMTQQMRQQFWVNEVSGPLPAGTAERCIRTVLPERDVTCIAMGPPSRDYDVEAANEYTRSECLERGWHALALLLPEWSAARVEAGLAKPAVVGLKPYYSLIGSDPNTRDRHQQASIFDFLPRHALEVANARRAWITLHVPKAERLPHPDNIREVKEIRENYPQIGLVIAHLGRCYTLPHAEEGLPPLADDPGLVFDISAVLNPDVLRLAFELFGPERLLYGTDNPVFYMRGRRQWQGRRYINRTSADFHFNQGAHEPPQVEARYTLFMYEALKAVKDVCEERRLRRDQIEAVFRTNAERLLGAARAGCGGG